MNDSNKNEVLIGGIEKVDIKILSYNPSWPDLYQEHAVKIRTALESTVLRIEHIGSTSVPGLAAKPIIDILLVVNDSGDEAAYLPYLEKAGYELRVREPDFYEHRMLRTPERNVHIHVFSPDVPEIDRYLIFRDRLRQNLGERQNYEKMKRDLAAQPWSDMNAYSEAKTEFIERAIAAASSS